MLAFCKHYWQIYRLKIKQTKIETWQLKSKVNQDVTVKQWNLCSVI